MVVGAAAVARGDRVARLPRVARAFSALQGVVGGLLHGGHDVVVHVGEGDDPAKKEKRHR